MRLNRLRPVPTDDPRPQPLDPQVVSRAVSPVAPAISEWAHGKTLIPVDEQRVEFVLKVAISQLGPDAYRMARVLQDIFSFPSDIELVKLLDQVVGLLPSSYRYEMGCWALRTGMRFPASPADMIEFIAEDGAQVAGKVYGVNNTMAQALVIRESDERTVTVNAEDVVANVTKGLYEEITPPLGIRYVNAPGLIAEALKAEKPKPPSVRKESPDPPEAA